MKTQFIIFIFAFILLSSFVSAVNINPSTGTGGTVQVINISSASAGNAWIEVAGGSVISLNTTGECGVGDYLYGFNTDGTPKCRADTGGLTSVTWENITGNQSYWNLSGFTNDLSFTTDHNNLTGLQGGNTSEYYHLNQTIWQYIMDNIYSFITSIPSYFMYTNGTNSNINYLQFNLTDTSQTPAEGKMYWNTNDGTLNLGMPNGDVNLQIGQEMLVRVKNNEGTDILNGQIVYVESATGGNILVKLADADTLSAHAVIGMATENITDQQHGYITTFGMVRDLNTSLYTDGTPIYLSQTAGEYTDTIPPAPAHTVKLGYIINSNDASGTIFVNIENGFDLENLDDVLVNNTLLLADGQALVYNATSGLWENRVVASAETDPVYTGAISTIGYLANTQTWTGNNTYSGNTTMTGTLNVTGTTTISGTTSLTGTTSISTLSGDITSTGTSCLIGSSGARLCVS